MHPAGAQVRRVVPVRKRARARVAALAALAVHAVVEKLVAPAVALARHVAEVLRHVDPIPLRHEQSVRAVLALRVGQRRRPAVADVGVVVGARARVRGAAAAALAALLAHARAVGGNAQRLLGHRVDVAAVLLRALGRALPLAAGLGALHVRERGLGPAVAEGRVGVEDGVAVLAGSVVLGARGGGAGVGGRRRRFLLVTPGHNGPIFRHPRVARRPCWGVAAALALVCQRKALLPVAIVMSSRLAVWEDAIDFVLVVDFVAEGVVPPALCFIVAAAIVVQFAKPVALACVARCE